MLPLTKDERFSEMEKRIQKLEKQVERNFTRTSDAFDTLRDVMLQMQKDNAQLRHDRDFLLEKYKEVIRRFEPVGTVVQPITNEIRENARLVRDIIVEDMGPPKKSVDDLFELVLHRKKIFAKTAARELKVDEKRISEWADVLKKQDLLEIRNNRGIELVLKH